ncbi:hypothetical protein LCGC14_1162860 [marine sediment metagenome]|uniref:Ankyrin repeat protein n=1 Tax=marine sediment metagenome TaxID=412755 RepID=A0A0F9MF63_9ZZZZ|nr:hypothetical protein [Candidatus Scalindua sp.]
MKHKPKTNRGMKKFRPEHIQPIVDLFKTWMENNKMEYVGYDWSKFIWDSMFHAISQYNHEAFDILMEYPITFERNDFELVHLAATVGNLEALKKMHEIGCDIHCLDGHPLRLATDFRHEEVIKYLKENHG